MQSRGPQRASDAGRNAPGNTHLDRRGSLLAGRVTKWLVLVLWLALAGVVSPLAAKLSGAGNNDAGSWLPRSAESTQALHRAQNAFPGSDRLVAVVVYARDSGLTDADRAAATADRGAFLRYAQDGQISPLIPSADGKAVMVSFPLAGDDDSTQSGYIDKIKELLGADRPAGLQTALTGPAGATADIVDAFSGLDTTLIFATASVVAVILLITYRSPLLWLVPLVSVGVASQLASAVVYLLIKPLGLTVNGQSQGIMTVLVFGAGTDYALLLIARYREELRRHPDRHAAMRVALRRCFPAILASASTVVLGLLCLLATQMNNIRGLGPVAAIGVAAAFVAMTTLLPALLVICGRWLFWPFVPRYSEQGASHDVAAQHGIWGRVAGFVARRPGRIWLGTAIALGALAFGMLGLHIGVTNADMYTKAVGSVTGQNLINEHFPRGVAEPAQILARAGTATQVEAAAHVPGVGQVQPPTTSADGQWVSIDAVLTDPPDSPAAQHTIDRLRTAVHAVPGADALVGGQTAQQLDTATANSHDARVAIPLILAVVFVILVLLLRAVVAPLLLVASVVLSFAAALGAATLVFHAIGHPRVDQGLPLLAFLFLVALGVDYTIFLMTRAREEAAHTGHRTAIARALAVTGGVITSAGFVLAATFSVLAVLPLVEMLQIGIVVALGVLLDTLVVRTLLVPALTIQVGRRIWWPGRLARVRDGAQAASAIGPQPVRVGG
ncbi:MAG: MMPL family transporter [Micromonosporaceae bacterium]|nr:MMPL family transporter [Micromonosporaceae bacterium]